MQMTKMSEQSNVVKSTTAVYIGKSINYAKE